MKEAGPQTNVSSPKIIGSRRDIYLISDTHFGHDNIIKYCDRPFKNSKEMDSYMVDRWNRVVKPGDIVYHLGDVYMGDSDNAASIMGRLHGRKRLILGNHDDGKHKVIQNSFQKVLMWRMFKDFGLLLTHVPVHESALRRKEGLNEPVMLKNVHGHIHNNPSPKGPYQCVCVEQIRYTPIHIEELRVKT